MVCEHTACKRKHSRPWLLWTETWCPYGSVESQTSISSLCYSLAKIKREREGFQSCLGTFWSLLSRLPCGRGQGNPGRLRVLKINGSSPSYAWQGQWMWFLLTWANQKSLIMTGISCCGFDTFQRHSFVWWSLFSRRSLVTGQSW